MKKALSSVNYRATVSQISHEADLALLEVADKTFWDGNNAGETAVAGLALGNLPELQEHINVIGYVIFGFPLSCRRLLTYVSGFQPVEMV